MAFICSDCGKEENISPNFAEDDWKRITLRENKVLLCRGCHAKRFRNSERVKKDKEQIERNLKKV